MASTLTAGQCKKYRQKHKKVFWEKDALRRRNYRQKKWKLIQLLTKKGYEFSERKNRNIDRVKESIDTATAANFVTEQNDNSAFSQAHIRSRSIRKVAKTLPKSPWKREEVISALANKFKLRVKPTQSKAGGPKNGLAESEKQWLKNLLDKPDGTYVTPGRRDHCYVRKFDGKSQYVQKRYLTWTLNELLNIANGSSLIKSKSSFEFSFGKKIKCHQLYEYIKSNRKYGYDRGLPQSSCLCEICKNVCFVAKSLNKKIKSCTMVQTDPHSLGEKYTCDSSSRTCMFSENECCYFTVVTMEEFPKYLWQIEY